MDRTAPKFDRRLFTDATYRARMRYDTALEQARKLEQDPDKATRLEAQRCRSCFYFRAMGGAACTTQPCSCCAKPEGYGSTNTDVLCLDCAKEHDLCKKCGGDLEMREDRSEWPA